MKMAALGSVVGATGLMIDGDWVESKDQDPGGEVRLTQLADVGIGVFLDKSARYMNLATSKRLNCTFLEPNDLLVARMPDPIGRSCIFPGSDQRCVTVVDVCVIRPDPTVADYRYLNWAINSQEFQSRLGRHIKGSTRQRISRKNLELVEIPLPALTVQRQIAMILDQGDELRRKRRKSITITNQLPRSLFEEMFGAQRALHAKKWPEIRLSDVAQLINGDRSSNYPSGDDLVESGILFLNTKNIDGSGINLSECNFITEQKFRSLSQGKLKRHDLVITLRGTLGQCVEFDCRYETGFINAQMMIIRPAACLLPMYLREFIAHPRTQALLKRDSSGN
jgi:type I restriction enzyme, S subunit